MRSQDAGYFPCNVLAVIVSASVHIFCTIKPQLQSEACIVASVTRLADFMCSCVAAGGNSAITVDSQLQLVGQALKEDIPPEEKLALVGVFMGCKL